MCFFFFFFPSNALWSPNIFISYFDKTVGTISIPLIISFKMLNSCGLFIWYWGGASLVAQMVKNLPTMLDT